MILILAMAFLSAVLIISIALLQLSFTSSASLDSFRAERVLRYTSDGAMQAGINYLAKNPNMAQKGTTFVTGPESLSGTMRIPIEDEPQSGSVNPAVTSSSFLTLDWKIPADVSSSGEKDDDGGQKPREAILTVSCYMSNSAAGAKEAISCGSSGTKRIIAQARVRYEVDYGNNARTGVPYPAGQRAIIPKIVWWSSKG